MTIFDGINDFRKNIKDKNIAKKLEKELALTKREKYLLKLHNGENLPIYLTRLILKKNEVCHFECSAKRYITEVTKKHVERHDGASIRIAKRFSVHIGCSKSHVNKIEDEVKYSGKLFITNKRIIFSGQIKSFTVAYRNLIAITPYSDGFELQSENISYGIIINTIDGSKEVNAILYGVFSNMVL